MCFFLCNYVYIIYNGNEHEFGVGLFGNRGYMPLIYGAIEKGHVILNHENLTLPLLKYHPGTVAQV